MKTLPHVVTFLAMCAILCGCGTTTRLQTDPEKPQLYLALFSVTIGEDNKLQDFQLLKVIDPFIGYAVHLELPQTFIDQARNAVEGQHFPPTIRHGILTNTLTSFTYSPGGEKHEPAGIAFSALNGAMCSYAEFPLLGEEAAATTYVTNSGLSVFGFNYYAVGRLPKATSDQRETLVEAEIQRSLSNMPNARILSRRDFSTGSQTIEEVTCKHPRNKALTMRARYICNDRQMLAFTAVTTNGVSTKDSQAFDRMFKAFRFP